MVPHLPHARRGARVPLLSRFAGEDAGACAGQAQYCRRDGNKPIVADNSFLHVTNDLEQWHHVIILLTRSGRTPSHDSASVDMKGRHDRRTEPRS